VNAEDGTSVGAEGPRSQSIDTTSVASAIAKVANCMLMIRRYRLQQYRCKLCRVRIRQLFRP
jgi:hypothetical protein